MVSEEIALQFAVTHGRTDGRQLVNIEIDIVETAEIKFSALIWVGFVNFLMNFNSVLMIFT